MFPDRFIPKSRKNADGGRMDATTGDADENADGGDEPTDGTKDASRGEARDAKVVARTDATDDDVVADGWMPGVPSLPPGRRNFPLAERTVPGSCEILLSWNGDHFHAMPTARFWALPPKKWA